MRLVDTPEELARASEALAHRKTFFIDTEFESNREGKTLSLLQVSAGEEIFLVDALRLKNLRALVPALTANGSLWVLHAGLQDLELIARAFGDAPLPDLFDVQIAWAFLGPEYGVSLAYLQYKLLGLRPSKAHQTDDWLQRPLPRSLLEYAAADIEHLPEIAQLLRNKIDALGRGAAVLAACRELLLPEAEPAVVQQLGLESFRNAWQLEAAGQAVLLELIDWYNQLPSQEASSLQPKTLLAIAGRRPQNMGELRRLKGVSPRVTDRYGVEIIRRIKVGSSLASDARFTELTPPPYATFQEIRLEAWLDFVRAETCARVEIAPEVALPAKLMRRIRTTILRTGAHERGAGELVGWRRELLGAVFTELSASAPR
jgi:ribonuclease D